MLMMQLRDYVMLHGRVSLQDLARHFRLNESVVISMMNIWIKKGRITSLTTEQSGCSTSQCSDCFGCAESASQFYLLADS